MPAPEELTADERTRLERFDCAPADMAKALRIHDQQRVHIDNLEYRLAMAVSNAMMLACDRADKADARIAELEQHVKDLKAEVRELLRNARLPAG